MTSPSFWLRAGSLAMLASVAAGAFGAHALRGRLPPELLEVWETAARYMAYHGLALLAVAWLADRGVAGAPAAGCCFLAGIVLFCGSLMALALTGRRWLGAVTPLGGLAFLAGWARLLFAAWR